MPVRKELCILIYKSECILDLYVITGENLCPSIICPSTISMMLWKRNKYICAKPYWTVEVMRLSEQGVNFSVGCRTISVGHLLEFEDKAVS
jgi:hypothetical protein